MHAVVLIAVVVLGRRWWFGHVSHMPTLRLPYHDFVTCLTRLGEATRLGHDLAQRYEIYFDFGIRWYFLLFYLGLRIVVGRERF